MKHIGSTALLLVSLGLLVVFLPRLHYKQDVIAASSTPTQPPTPSASYSIQTAHQQMLLVTPTLLPTSATSAHVSLDEVQSSLLGQVNTYRKSQGLENVSAEKTTCDFAMLRVQEIMKDFSHKGFNDRIANKTLPYPMYSLVVENIAMNSEMGSVIPDWIASSGHAANMRANTEYGCIGHSGEYYVYEGWMP